MHPAPRTILIVNIRLIGDVILTTPLIGLLHAAYPEAAIDLLVNRGTGEFLARDPRVRSVFYSERGVVGDKRRFGGYQLQIFRGYDLAVNMNASDRGTLAVLLAGKRRRVGFFDGASRTKDFWKKWLLSDPLRLPDDTHKVRLCEQVASVLGLRVERLEAKVFWSAQDAAKVAALLAERVAGARFFVVHPFARWVYKYWQLQRFAEVSDAVARRYGLVPVWTSSPAPEEVELLQSAVQLCQVAPLVIPGALNLNQMTCLLDAASLYIGLDTAVSHLAATVGTPMVVLYGPTLTDHWFPWDNGGAIGQGWNSSDRPGRGSCLVVRNEMACVPCGKAGCDDVGETESPCLAAITSEDVLQAVDCLMKKPAGDGGAATADLLKEQALHG